MLKFARWLPWFVQVLAACFALAPPLCEAATQQPTQAQGAVMPDGAAPLRGPMVLPYHWDRLHKGVSGWAEFEIPFVLTPRPGQVYGIYFLRLGNAYEVSLNGTVLQRSGNLDKFDGYDYAKAPRYVAVPDHLLRGENLLKVRLRAEGGRRGGLAAPLIGPDEEVRRVFASEFHWRVVGSFAVVVFSLLIGVGGVMLWLTQVDVRAPRGLGHDSVFLFAGIAELAWALRVGDAIIEHPPLPWVWWGTLQTAALAGWLSSMTMFCLNLACWNEGPKSRRMKGALAALFLIGCAAAYMSLELKRGWVLTGWYGAAGAFFAAFAAIFILAAFRSGSREHRLVALALAVNTVVGLRDIAVFRFSTSYGDNTLIRYSSLLFGMVVGYVLITRFSAATAQARHLMQNLEVKVSEREAQLRRSYDQLEAMAREQERTAERTRILRDMHDGVGSHITSAIRQLESGKADRRDVLQTLRESLDHLKLTIDSMNLPQGDVTALLANLRYRLEPRLAASDIQLQWDVNAIDPLPRFDAGHMRHLQFIVLEALSNVLQHAHATVVRIQASVCADGALIRLVDNGRGFDSRVPYRKGLKSMHERARAIGAQLVVESSETGTVTELLLGTGGGAGEGKLYGQPLRATPVVEQSSSPSP